MTTCTPIEVDLVEACPNCGSQATSHWCFASDLLLRTSDQEYEYRSCKSCLVLFLSTRPAADKLSLVYPDAYHPYGGQTVSGNAGASLSLRIHQFLSARAKRRFRQRVSAYYDKVQKGSVFVDFGCGAGVYLDRMRQYGCSTIGMDFSTQALRKVAAAGHRAVPVTSEGWNSLPPNSVNFVRVNHVIEHLYGAKEPLMKLHDRMKPGALIHLAVPNPNGLSATLFRRYWHGLDCPRHVILYPAPSLASLLRRLRFRVDEVLFEPLTKDHIRSWAYFLHRRGVIKESNPDGFIERPLVRLATALPMSIAQLLGKSDRFHIFASKQL